MYPYYKGYVENIELNYDDRVGMQNLYGMCAPTMSDSIILSVRIPEPPFRQNFLNYCISLVVDWAMEEMFDWFYLPRHPQSRMTTCSIHKRCLQIMQDCILGEGYGTPLPKFVAGREGRVHCNSRALTLSLPSSKATFSQPFKENCISDTMRIWLYNRFSSE